MNRVPFYQDMPLPPRANAVPEGFQASLAWDDGRECLVFSARMNGAIVCYRGRGYFTENMTDLPGAGFRVAVTGLLDPFLWKYRTIEPRHFLIVLRVVVPKLRRDGMRLDCGLNLEEKSPVHARLTYAVSSDRLTMNLSSDVPRASLRELEGLNGYMLSGNTLYRITPTQLAVFRNFNDGEQEPGPESLRQLKALCKRSPELFSGDTDALLRYGEVQERPAVPETKRPDTPFQLSIDDIWGSLVGGKSDTADMPNPMRKALNIPRPAPKQIPLDPPCLSSVELSDYGGAAATRSAMFLREAHKLRDMKVESARFVRFQAGRPIYSDMNSAQRAWYFFWRGKFEQGIVYPTDISYIYVAAYELLNGVTASGAEALARLLRLWETYRGDFPYLDRCMPGWCVDFMLLNDLGTDFDAIHERIPFGLYECGVPAELFINRRLADGVSNLPFEVICRISSYDALSSRYCADAERRKSFEETAKRAFEAVERAAKDRESGVLDGVLMCETVSIHESCYGAILNRALSKRVTLHYRPVTRSTEFRNLLAGILRAVENALRRRDRFPGRLKEEPLPAFAAEAIAPVLASLTRTTASVKQKEEHTEPVLPAEPVVIDLSRARELEAASWENTRRLLEALGEEVEDAAEEPLPEPIPEPVPEPIAEPMQEESDGEGVSLYENLSELAQSVLKACLDGNADEVRKLCAAQMTFPEAVYEEINEKSLEIIGDLVLDTENGSVYEEYLGELGI